MGVSLLCSFTLALAEAGWQQPRRLVMAVTEVHELTLYLIAGSTARTEYHTISDYSRPMTARDNGGRSVYFRLSLHNCI